MSEVANECAEQYDKTRPHVCLKFIDLSVEKVRPAKGREPVCSGHKKWLKDKGFYD
jgi:hypothetical protein